MSQTGFSSNSPQCRHLNEHQLAAIQPLVTENINFEKDSSKNIFIQKIQVQKNCQAGAGKKQNVPRTSQSLYNELFRTSFG